ncbi:MAG: hypothetical protein SGI72_15800 [Planctomycetota bacterium]|nr:hypothetical protein [Planctomycetota bacterium]
MIRTAVLVLICGGALAACAVSRAGWGRGKFVVVVESIALQVRRSTIRVEDVTGDLVMNWIGARAPSGQPALAEFSVTLFDDRNGDHVPQSIEVSSQRVSSERADKILFSDIRVPADKSSATWNVLVSARTAGGNSTSNVFAFVEDR